MASNHTSAVGKPMNLEAFRAFVHDTLARWQAPGAAVGVLQGDEISVCEGYGLRDLASVQPVTRRTLFAIGSSTKAFTTTALSILVDEGKLDWDQPVGSSCPCCTCLR